MTLKQPSIIHSRLFCSQKTKEIFFRDNLFFRIFPLEGSMQKQREEEPTKKIAIIILLISTVFLTCLFCKLVQFMVAARKSKPNSRTCLHLSYLIILLKKLLHVFNIHKYVPYSSESGNFLSNLK